MPGTPGRGSGRLTGSRVASGVRPEEHLPPHESAGRTASPCPADTSGKRRTDAHFAVWQQAAAARRIASMVRQAVLDGIASLVAASMIVAAWAAGRHGGLW
ncbi:hypothetical protein GCM10025782_21180 [Pedococcus ginsenosidimutans]|uniref:RDD domain-containing protein n=1 Tax=Pedococcus ginsenosidimutans TaxID=490570 RepID=A0ABP8YAF9_9MICO